MSMSNDYLDTLVKRIKATGKFDDVRFIRSLGDHPAEKPIMGFVAACGAKESTAAPCFLTTGGKAAPLTMINTVTATIRLYAPRAVSGSELLKKARLICRELSAADKQGAAFGIKLDEPSYSKDSDAMFSLITLKIEKYTQGVDCDE